jgi:hypothetical protein
MRGPGNAHNILPLNHPYGDGSDGKRRFPCRALHGSKRKPCRRWGKPTLDIQTRLVGNRQLAARPRDGSSPSSLTTRLGKEPTNENANNADGRNHVFRVDGFKRFCGENPAGGTPPGVDKLKNPNACLNSGAGNGGEAFGREGCAGVKGELSCDPLATQCDLHDLDPGNSQGHNNAPSEPPGLFKPVAE